MIYTRHHIFTKDPHRPDTYILTENYPANWEDIVVVMSPSDWKNYFSMKPLKDGKPPEDGQRWSTVVRIPNRKLEFYYIGISDQEPKE